MTARQTASPYFMARQIDDAPELLDASYRLRYQVYCHERSFLSAAAYPTGLEVDGFDGHSSHVGVLDPWGTLVATGRVVNLTKPGTGLPLFRHCRIFAHETELIDPDNHVVEISRVAMSRRYRRRSIDGTPERRDVRGAAFLALLKGLYHASKRMDATHWLAATEKSLHRLLEHHGFPFRLIGPEANYSGPVAPYLMNLAEFEGVVRSRRIAALDDFLSALDDPPRTADVPAPLAIA